MKEIREAKNNYCPRIAYCSANEDYNDSGSLVFSGFNATETYRFGFNGKEKIDSITGFTGTDYDFGNRIYDARLDRFLSTDPLAKTFPMLSPYVYAANSPIRYIDIDGKGPGDPFKTPDEAAIDFGKTYNDNSIGAKKEYGSTLIKVVTKDEVYYTYVQPMVGTTAASTHITRGLSGQETVALLHTHANYDPNYKNEVFSKKDMENSDKQGIPGYVATPGGTLKMYDPKTKLTSIVSTDLPSDPNSPASQRMNNIDPVPLPKNEPTYGVMEFIKHNILNPIGQGAGAIYNKDPASSQPASSGGASGGSTGGNSGGDKPTESHRNVRDL